MAACSRLAEATAMTLEVLSKYKCKFPKTQAIVKADIMANIFLVKTKLKARNPSKLPTMTDETRVALMKLLDHLVTFLYSLNDSRMPLIIFRSLSWTIKYGICAYSAPGFASTGMILTGVLLDIQGGATLGQYALSVLKQTQSSATASRTMFLVYAFLLSWTRPIRDGLKPLLQAYDLGFQSG
jgi:predicted ATPase